MGEGLKIVVVGATGLVGGVMLRVLEERGFGAATLQPLSVLWAGK